MLNVCDRCYHQFPPVSCGSAHYENILKHACIHIEVISHIFNTYSLTLGKKQFFVCILIIVVYFCLNNSFLEAKCGVMLVVASPYPCID